MFLHVRKIFFIFTFLVILVSIYLFTINPVYLWWMLLPIIFVIIGILDMIQKKSAIIRNFPVVGHLRGMLSGFGLEIRQ